MAVEGEDATVVETLGIKANAGGSPCGARYEVDHPPRFSSAFMFSLHGCELRLLRRGFARAPFNLRTASGASVRGDRRCSGRISSALRLSRRDDISRGAKTRDGGFVLRKSSFSNDLPPLLRLWSTVTSAELLLLPLAFAMAISLIEGPRSRCCKLSLMLLCSAELLRLVWSAAHTFNACRLALATGSCFSARLRSRRDVYRSWVEPPVGYVALSVFRSPRYGLRVVERFNSATTRAFGRA